MNKPKLSNLWKGTAVGLLTAFALTMLPQKSQAQKDCENVVTLIDEAQAKFNNGRFHEVITLLTPSCLETIRNDDKMDKGKVIQINEMLAIAYIGIEQPDLARQPIRDLLKRNRDYSPPPSKYSSKFKEIINEERKKLKGRISKWLVAGLVGGPAVALYFYFFTGTKEKPLPNPPDIRGSQ